MADTRADADTKALFYARACPADLDIAWPVTDANTRAITHPFGLTCTCCVPIAIKHTHTAAAGGGRHTYSHSHTGGADPHDHLQSDADAVRSAGTS